MIHSKEYTDAAKGQPCTFQIPGVCNGDWTTTVSAHIRDEHKGGGSKASDISTADACFCCHDVFDGRVGQMILSKEDWLFYALRGLQRTIENRIARGIIKVPMDTTKRKSGKKITSGQKMQSRPMRNEKFKRKLNGETVKR